MDELEILYGICFHSGQDDEPKQMNCIGKLTISDTETGVEKEIRK